MRALPLFMALFLALFLLLLGGVLPPVVRAQEDLSVIAVVNDDVVTTEDLQSRMTMMMKLTGLPDNAEVRQKLTVQLMQKLIDEALQTQQARKQKIVISPEERKQAYAQLASRQNMDPDAIENHLRGMGVDLATLDKQIDAELAWSHLVMQRVRPKIVLTEGEVDEAIEAISGEKGFDEWQVGEIILPIARPEDSEDAQKLAQKLIQEVKSGTDFDKVAAQFKGEGSTNAREERRWVNSGTVDGLLATWLRGAQRNEVSAPIRTAAGVHVLKLFDKRRMIGMDPAETEVALQQIVFAVASEQGETQAIRRFTEAKAAAEKIHGCDDFLRSVENEKDVTAHDLGRLQLKHVSPEVRGIISALPVGQVSQPFRTPLGIHLMIVCERITPRSTPIDRDQVRQMLGQKKLTLEAMRLMRNIRREAYVEVRL